MKLEFIQDNEYVLTILTTNWLLVRFRFLFRLSPPANSIHC